MGTFYNKVNMQTWAFMDLKRKVNPSSAMKIGLQN